MRFLALWVVLTLAVFAAQPTDNVIKLYQQQRYEAACLEGARIVRDYKNSETFVNTYALACLKSDYIDFAAIGGVYLRGSQGSRQNASYILTVVLQKKLLTQALADNIDLSSIRLPETPHILSKVFSAYASGNYVKDGTVMVINLGGNQSATLDSLTEGGHFKVRIRQYENDRMTGEHLYW
jgi:hypothetical protein